MYAKTNFRSKKALKDAVKAGEEVTIYSPGPFPAKENGREFLEGPHYPEAHTWYATVELKDGKVIKILS